MQLVYNNTGATNKCSVTLEFNQPRMIIYRQKRPELLRITLFTEGEEVNEAVYEDRVAQQIIDQSFGTKDVWTSCCYLAQFSRSYLLSASNSDKTELLNNLSFTAEDPELYINRIDTELNRINQEFSTKQGIFTNECNRFGEEIAKANLDMNLFLSPSDQEEMKNKIKELKSSYEDLKRKNLIDQQARGAKSALEKRKESLFRNLVTLPAINEEKMAQLEAQLEVLQIEGRSVPHLLQASRIRKELETLAKEEEKLKPVNLEQLKISQADLEEARITQLTIQKQKFDEAMTLVKRLSIPYNKTVIDEEIQSINQQLEMQPKIQMFVSIAEIKTKLNLLQQAVKAHADPAELDLEIQALREKIDHLKMAVGVLKCPHCTKPVRMIKGTLAPSDTDPPSPARIGECEKRLQDLTTTRQKMLETVPLKQKLEMLMGMVDQLPEIIPKALTPAEVNRLKQRINDLTRINIIEAPTLDPQELRKIKNLLKSREQLLERKERLQSELAQIPVEGENIDPTTHQNRVDQVKRDLTQLRNQKEKRLVLEQQIEDITTQWKEISLDDTLTQRMTEISKEIENADSHLKTAQKIDLLVDRQNKLEKEKTDLEELYTYLTNLQRLRTIALEVEGHALQETIDSINNVLSDIASALFEKDREMSIRLSAFKQLKTKDRIKPMINLGIKYGNGEYDNVNQLSGGEGDRISLAITLALSRLNTCPLLLLDECMASLDADLKEVCLGAIRDALGGTKTVIIINHEGTEGHYDNVVQLDD
jgi:DNA repair exonuclease SbcCD ATPase subunit